MIADHDGTAPEERDLRRAGITSMLVSDHPHLFETGGENYHTDFSAWQYVRATRATVEDPTRPVLAGRARAAHRAGPAAQALRRVDHLFGSDVPVIRQPFAPGDPVPFSGARAPKHNRLFDLDRDPLETEDLAGSARPGRPAGRGRGRAFLAVG